MNDLIRLSERDFFTSENHDERTIDTPRERARNNLDRVV